MKESVVCPVCESATTNVGKKEIYDVMRCNVCTLVFLTPVDSIKNEIGGDDFAGRNLETAHEIRYSRLLQPKYLLDFGCGKEEFTQFCNIKKNITALGIDSHTRLQLKHLIDLPPFEAITMIEVIEHLPNPKELITRLVKHLNIGGILYIEGSFTDTEELYGKTDFDLLKWPYLNPGIGHCTFFNQKSMETLAKLVGLEFVEARFNPNVFRLIKKG